jgi:hypothetical protein
LIGLAGFAAFPGGCSANVRCNFANSRRKNMNRRLAVRQLLLAGAALVVSAGHRTTIPQYTICSDVRLVLLDALRQESTRWFCSRTDCRKFSGPR